MTRSTRWYETRRRYGRTLMRDRYHGRRWTCGEQVGAGRNCRTPLQDEQCPTHPPILDLAALADMPVGRRVASLRQYRNLNQQTFADLIGRSKSWVDKVERGIRVLDRVSVLYELADVLKVPPAVFMDRWENRQ